MRTPYGDLPDRWVEHASMCEQHDFLQARLTRRGFLKGAGLAAAGPGLWLQPAAATVAALTPRHVGFGTDPRQQAVVSFATQTPFRRASVEYGLDDAFGSTVEVDLRTVRGVPTVYGHARLEGLAAGTPYRYRVHLDGTVSDTRTLRTAPGTAEPFTFTAFGDQGVSASARAVLKQLARVRPAFHLLAGDLCYANSSGSGGRADTFDPRVWDAWLRMIEPVASRSAWMCATGNHDMEPGYGPQGYDGYLSRFLLPSTGAAGCPSTYSFRYGDVGFVSLDANDVSYEIPHNLGYSGGGQTAWLERELAALRTPGSGIEFVVVFFHHCAFSTNSVHGSDGGVRDQWVPLVDRYEVDLVINGHAHLYERTAPLRHGRVTEAGTRSGEVDSRRGTTYVTAGGGGRVARESFTRGGSVVVESHRARVPEAAPWSLPTRTTEHSFLAVDVAPGRGTDAPASMRVRALDKHGRLFDDVTLRRSPSRPRDGLDPALLAAAGGSALAAAAAGTALRRRAAAKDEAGRPGAR